MTWLNREFYSRKDLQDAHLEMFGEECCKKIFNTPNDVSYRFYRALFADKEDEWNEKEETKTQGNVNSVSNS